jgi:hypothetical protein
MTLVLVRRRRVLCTLFALIFGLSASAAQPADHPSGSSIASISPAELGMVASGAVEDTLRACLSRIPRDASIGQRMIAERSCYRDETDRNVIQAVPNAEYVSQ